MLEEGRFLLERIRNKSLLLILPIIFFLISFKSSDKNIDKISNFLNNFKTISANFIQLDNNGNPTTGNIKIKRPGKMRIEYNKPISNLIISDGIKVALINKKSSSINLYSLNQIPIKVLLSNDFSLKNYQIINYKEANNIIEVEITSKKDKELGSITFIFEHRPMQIKKWIINEINGSKTEIFLSDVFINKKLDNNFFRIIDPRKIPFGRKE